MTTQYQLEFFRDPEMVRLESQMYDCKESSNKVRKRLFAENNRNRKLIDDLSRRLDIIERNICKGC